MFLAQIVANVKDFFTGDSLGKKVRRGSLFILLSSVLKQILEFTRRLILARILLPADFGLVGIGIIVTSGLSALSGTGFRKALIQTSNNSKSLLNTAWSVEILRGIVLCCITFFSAPLVAGFFNNESATNILRAMSVLPLMQGLTNIGTIYFEKELQFHRLLVHEQISIIITFVTSLSYVFIQRNAWAIVVGSIAGGISQMITSYILHPYRPSWRIHSNEFRLLFGFGKNIFIVGIVLYLVTQGDNMLVGRLVGTSALGAYMLAYSLANLHATTFAGSISKVTFPAYARIQTDPARLQDFFLGSFRIAMMVLVPITVILFLLSDSLILVLYGPKWEDAIRPFQVLCFLGLFRANSYVIASLLQGVGKPDLPARVRTLELAIFVAIIYHLTMKYGTVGAALSGTIACFVSLLFMYYYAVQILPSGLHSMLMILLRNTFGSLVMIILLLLLRRSAYSLLPLMGLVLLSAVTYFLVTLAIDRIWRYRPVDR